MIQEGYNKVRILLDTGAQPADVRDVPQYKGGSFKVPELFRWTVIVSGPKMIEELRKAGDDELSFDEAVAEVRVLMPLLYPCRN